MESAEIVENLNLVTSARLKKADEPPAESWAYDAASGNFSIRLAGGAYATLASVGDAGPLEAGKGIFNAPMKKDIRSFKVDGASFVYSINIQDINLEGLAAAAGKLKTTPAPTPAPTPQTSKKVPVGSEHIDLLNTLGFTSVFDPNITLGKWRIAENRTPPVAVLGFLLPPLINPDEDRPLPTRPMPIIGRAPKTPDAKADVTIETSKRLVEEIRGMVADLVRISITSGSLELDGKNSLEHTKDFPGSHNALMLRLEVTEIDPDKFREALETFREAVTQHGATISGTVQERKTQIAGKK